eukprot:2826321-Alexandrium_andersonii.AAC.1
MAHRPGHESSQVASRILELLRLCVEPSSQRSNVVIMARARWPSDLCNSIILALFDLSCGRSCRPPPRLGIAAMAKRPRSPERSFASAFDEGGTGSASRAAPSKRRQTRPPD